ncbi:MAG: glycosyltransferase family 9 protein [Candidatus Omnitrophota bacterium]
MKRATVRWLDSNIGRPICLILTMHRKIRDILARNAKPYVKPSKILFIKLIEQGSTVLAYPALKRAGEFVGVDNVYFLVFTKNRPILDLLGAVPPSNVIEIDPRSFISFARTAVLALREIRRRKIDAVIDMEFFARASAILSYLSGASKRAGLHLFASDGPYTGNLFTHKMVYNPYIHTRVYFVSLVEALKHAPAAANNPMIFKVPEAEESVPCFSPGEDEKAALIMKLGGSDRGLPGRPIIILNPNISDLIPMRRWPQDNFIRLGGLIRKAFPEATIVITGTEDEKEGAGVVAGGIEGAISLAGITSLRELLTLYCVGELLVTNDSGPAHFASLTPVKAIILFGPETPALYGPPDQAAEVISTDLVCSPCVNVCNQRKTICQLGTCMKDIKVEDVFSTLKRLL